MAIKHLDVLYSNPFLFAPNLVAFFKTLGKKERSVLLSYLVLPLTNRKETNKFLRFSKSTSSLFTMARDRERIYGLSESVSKLRHMTNLSLQYAIDCKWVTVHSDLSVTADVEEPAKIAVAPGDVNACSKLGSLFSPYDVRVIYRTLGIREL